MMGDVIMPYAAVFADLGDDLIDVTVTVINKMGFIAVKLCNLISENVSTVQNLGDSEIVSTFATAGSTLMALLMAIEICQQAMGFHFEDFNEAARFLFKVVIYKVFVENSTKIAGAVIDLFSGSFTSVGGEIVVATGNMKTVATNAKENIMGTEGSYTTMEEGLLGINKFLLALCIAGCAIMMAIILFKMIISMAGILFEIGIHTAVAPIAVATLVNHETRSLGIGYIKSLAGVCVTVGVYSLCFSIYKTIYTPIQEALNTLTSGTGTFEGIGYFVGPLFCLFLLDIAIKNAGNVVQRALG